jgi:demethylmenaquinone methyltransferase/2-methoxy-6-polyprenyl-1,4-benzoquinol methylase
MEKSVKPYQPEGSKKKQVSEMFDNIAPTYDLLNRLLSLGIDVQWRRKAIRKLAARRPKVLLDVATGTADVAIEAVRQLQPEQVVGVDIAAEMLEIGRRKLSSRGLEGVVSLQQADSENLPFADNMFDAVTVAFGVRNFENLERGLSEMHRVLKPGGEMVILEFSKPKLPPFRQLYDFYFQHILPFIGRITSKDPKAYTYLYESVQAFPDGKNFEKLLNKTGFQCTHSDTLTLGICSIYFGQK